MKAKIYLEKIESMNIKIDADIEELAQLKAIATKTTSVLGGERVQSSGSQQKMADCVIKIQLQEQKINNEIDRFIEYRDEAKGMVFAACDADCIRLLLKRYFGELNKDSEEVEYKDWKQIANELGYSYKWVKDGLHQRALAQLQKALDERSKT